MYTWVVLERVILNTYYSKTQYNFLEAKRAYTEIVSWIVSKSAYFKKLSASIETGSNVLMRKKNLGC